MTSYETFQEETTKLQRQNDMLETRLRNSPPALEKTGSGRGHNKELENKVTSIVSMLFFLQSFPNLSRSE